LSYFQGNHYPFLDFFASLGKYGVDFFFILSGFIINYSNSSKSDNHTVKFIKNRIIRIYVPYLPIGITLYFLYLVLPSLSQNPRDISWITSFTLFPHGSPALAVAWTLSFEMFFYLIYSLCIVNKKFWHLFLFFWVGAILGIQSTGVEFDAPFFQLVFSYYNLEFILGYILSLLIVNNVLFNKNIVGVAIILFLIGFILSKYYDFLPYSFYINSVFSLFSFFLIYYSITYKSIRLNKGNVLMLIGNSSYSLYLVHGPLHAFIERYLPKTESLIIYVIYIVFVSAICLIAGYIYYFIFEKKCIQALRKISLKK
ncbi:acyltransferase, partial [Parapusillimonas sp. SGNA-6]|nr:acyltransferase [Parapusillimonas sp. SGNA-6]